MPFDMSLMDFADSLAPDDLNQWTEVVNGTAEQSPEGEGEADGEKKVRHFGIVGHCRC